MQSKLGEGFSRFMASYEEAVMSNHDLFFTKRTVNKLLLPLLNDHPLLTRELLERRVGEEQQRKEEYLECLSAFVVELERDKKHLGEDCFTLDEVVQMMLMEGRKREGEGAGFSQEFLLYSMKKLTKEVKKQFLLKYGLAVESFEEFPSDQEIPLELLQTCFEMECTKVLFKNQVWSELLQLIPQSEQRSKFHQRTIDANVCLEFVNRYFAKLD